MGLFSKFFKNENLNTTIYKMIVDAGNGFYAWNGKLYHSDIVRACIRPASKAVGKIVGKHIFESIDKNGDKYTSVNPRSNIRFMLEEPNDLMCSQVMQEKVATQLLLNGNAFLVIVRNDFGAPVGLYPIDNASVEAIDKNGELTLRFLLIQGGFREIPYSDVIHLRGDFFNNTLFGDSPAAALTGMMNVVNISDQSVQKAIKNSGIIRWLLKYANATRPEDLKQNAKEFAESFLNVDNGTGVAAINSQVDAQQITTSDYVPNAAQTSKQVERIYAFFNTNAKIVHSSYSENEWISYYETVIEPIAAQMAHEYTRKLFSRKERALGNKIIFECSDLTFASMSTKLSLVQFVDRGMMTPNEVRRYFGLEPIEGGDMVLLRKDTGIVDERTAIEDNSDEND